jgi:hypothetical protein
MARNKDAATGVTAGEVMAAVDRMVLTAPHLAEAARRIEALLDHVSVRSIHLEHYWSQSREEHGK